MKPARLVWIIWCLLWCLIWFGLAIYDMYVRSADMDYFRVWHYAMYARSAGSALRWSLSNFLFSAVSLGAVVAPVGDRHLWDSARDWWREHSPAGQARRI